MKKCVLLLGLFASLVSSAQSRLTESALRSDPIWFNHYESRGFLSTSLSLDEAGNIYTGGTFESFLATPDTVFEMPRLPFRETFANYPWLQKHDPNGKLQWTAYAMGQARLHDIALDDKGHIYITGEVWSNSLVFVSANGQQDSLDKAGDYHRGAYIAKFNAEGQLLKSYYFSLNRHESFNSLVIDSKGQLILGGNYLYSQNSELKRSYLLLKMSADLAPLWVMDGDTLGYSQINSLTVDGSDNIYVGGSYTLDLKMAQKQVSSPHQNQQAFIAKLSAKGKLKWLQGEVIGPENAGSQMVINGIALDFWRNVYFTGSRFGGRFYLAKLDRKGQPKWITASRPSNRSNYPFGLTERDNKELLVFGHGYGGSFLSTDPVDTLSYTANGSTDFFIGQISKKGRLEKFLFGGGRGSDYVTDIAFRDGKIYVLGHDLGGPPVVFKEQSIHAESRFTYSKKGPVMWLACFEWEED